MPFIDRSGSRLRSANLEYNVVEHCNYACRECSHLSPHMTKGRSDLAAFARDLSALAAVYRVARFKFVGGEPLLHPNLLGFVAAVRDSGIADEIEVATNGSMLHRTDDDLLRSIDVLSISWYPDPRCDEQKIARARDRCDACGTTLTVKRALEFRTMQLTEPIAEPGLREDVFRSCQIAHSWNCQTFLDGTFYLCSRPLFTGAYLRARGRETPDLRRVDGIALHEPDLRRRLEDYLSRAGPLESCRHCLGTVGKRVPWAQMSPAERRSTAPLGRRAEQEVSRGILAYLLGWARAERLILSFLPSPRVAALLATAKESGLLAVSPNHVTSRRYPRRRGGRPGGWRRERR